MAFAPPVKQEKLVGRASVPAMLVPRAHATLHRRDACATKFSLIFKAGGSSYEPQARP
jgi:hypothetical protein